MLIGNLEEEIERRPKAPELRLRYSRELERQGDYDKAFREAILAVEHVIPAKSFPEAAILDCYEQLARMALRQNYRFLAERIALDGLSRGGSNARLYLRLAQSLLSQNRKRDAEKAAKKALAVDPRLVEAQAFRDLLSSGDQN